MDHLESHLASQSLEHLSFWHEVRAAVALRDLPRGPSVVVDVGAGAGHMGQYIAREHGHASYRFIEPIESLAAHLVDVFGADARLDGLEQIGVADVVTVLDVVEHIEDDHAFLAEVVENMKPGSQLVITVPALPVLWSAWDVDLGHHRRYTRASLADAVRSLDLSDCRIDYLFPELLLPALLRRLGGGRVGSRRGHEVSEYPELPRWLDRSLWVVATVTARLRRVWPAGTSLILVARKR
jgi:SAM-dependent methyltransferase